MVLKSLNPEYTNRLTLTHHPTFHFLFCVGCRQIEDALAAGRSLPLSTPYLCNGSSKNKQNKTAGTSQVKAEVNTIGAASLNQTPYFTLTIQGEGSTAISKSKPTPPQFDLIIILRQLRRGNKGTREPRSGEAAYCSNLNQ